MTRATKAISPTTWGSPSRDPPSSPTPPTPSIETTKVVINHLNPQPIARPKTTISKTTSQKLAPPPANSQQKIVCGFHMHMELWELFKTHGRSLEQERREKKQRGRERNGYRHQEVPSKKKEITPIKQDIMLARWHHEIVLNHRSLHSELRSLVLKSSCKPYHHTFGRWINWGEEVIGGKTSPAGGAPHCACGLPMKLSWFNRNQESSVVFFCELRLADTKTGCSRAVNSGKWVQWQELDPVHALNTKNQLIETPAAYTLIGSDEEYSSCSDEDEDEDEDKDEDVNDSAFIETEDETSLPETDFRIADSGESERVGWDEHIITSIPAVNLKKLQFSSGFLDDDANGEGLGHVREPSPYELSDNEDPWQTYNPRKLQNNNRGDYWGNQSGGVGLDLEMKMRALAEKVDNDEGLYNGILCGWSK
ncbi:hypothetical protein BGZ76_011765 [Entomortierella beljakovae]|nr:hypothetical protein BGZ76_011765 [Entomortierella beljakovae]